MIYHLYVFNRHCQCIYFHQFHNSPDSKFGFSLNSLNGRLTSMPDELDEHCKLVYGVIYSVRNFVNKLKKEETPPLKDSVIVENSPYTCFSTSHFKLHFLETLTRMQWVLVTSKDVNNQTIKKLLFSMYQEAYINFVVKNPLIDMENKLKLNETETPWIGNAKFKTELEHLIQNSST
ncbi:TRAPP subunit bet5 [Coelomomyces lativittatus]|nr:TRAPP subunit bet5 [Coelomomyces lativittatus]